MLSSPLLQQFPFEAFGLELGDLVNLFTKAPVKASALLHAIFEIGRRYDMKEEHFLRAALRSYQEIHENYFQEIEDATVDFINTYGLEKKSPLEKSVLETIIQQEFSYQLDETRLANYEILTHYRSIFIGGKQPKLLINSALHPNQVKFILAREVGYRFLGLKERSYTSSPDKVDSFEQVLNDFKASYFAGALLMPRTTLLADLQEFFKLETWHPEYLLTMLEKYDVTPEMLLYRLSELIPQFFGTKLHFLRFHHTGDAYQLIKQFNMNRLLLPSGIGLHEHYCRRWLAMRLLRDMSAKGKPAQAGDTPLVGVQISEFLESHERFFSFGFARPLALTPEVGSSVVVGFRLTPDLRHTIRFVDDPAIPTVIINETCERCPLLEDQCKERGAKPTILHTEKQKAERQAIFSQLMAELQK